MNKTLALVAVIGALSFIPVGCHGQVPPSPAPTVSLSWTASTSCATGAACTYVISRAAVATGSTSCPATTGSAYTPLNQSTPVSGTSYIDASPATNACYVAQTVQNTLISVASSASNNGTPIVVAVVPLAPGSPSATEIAKNNTTVIPSKAKLTETADVRSPSLVLAQVNR